MTKEEKIKEFLETELNDGELVEVWNDYCDRNNMGEEQIYPLDFFDDYFENFEPHEIASQIYNATRFHPSDTWFSFDGYGRLITFNLLGGEIDTEALADFAVERDYSFGIWEIVDILEPEEDS